MNPMNYKISLFSAAFLLVYSTFVVAQQPDPLQTILDKLSTIEDRLTALEKNQTDNQSAAINSNSTASTKPSKEDVVPPDESSATPTTPVATLNLARGGIVEARPAAEGSNIFVDPPKSSYGGFIWSPLDAITPDLLKNNDVSVKDQVGIEIRALWKIETAGTHVLRVSTTAGYGNAKIIIRCWLEGVEIINKKVNGNETVAVGSADLSAGLYRVKIWVTGSLNPKKYEITLAQKEPSKLNFVSLDKTFFYEE